MTTATPGFHAEPWVVSCGTKLERAACPESAILLLSRMMAVDTEDLLKQIDEHGKAVAVYGFCEGHIHRDEDMP